MTVKERGKVKTKKDYEEKKKKSKKEKGGILGRKRRKKKKKNVYLIICVQLRKYKWTVFISHVKIRTRNFPCVIPPPPRQQYFYP